MIDLPTPMPRSTLLVKFPNGNQSLFLLDNDFVLYRYSIQRFTLGINQLEEKF